jgi:hypothetical protein
LSRGVNRFKKTYTAVATMAKQSLALAAVAAGLGRPTANRSTRPCYYMVTGGKN